MVSQAFSSALSAEHNTISALALITTVVTSSASLFTLLVIKRMNVWNGHIFLISLMTSFQLLYDLSYFTSIVNLNQTSYIVSYGFSMFGALGVAFTAIIVALTAFYVVFYRKNVQMLHRVYYVLITVSISAILPALLYVIGGLRHNAGNGSELEFIGQNILYYHLRIAAIALNFGISSATARKIYQMGSSEQERTVEEQALTTLAVRLLYYPLIQAVSWAGCVCFESIYGFDFDPDTSSTPEFIAQCFSILLTPSASIGFLVVFLVMQPRAGQCARRMLPSVFFFPHCGNSEPADERHVLGDDESGSTVWLCSVCFPCSLLFSPRPNPKNSKFDDLDDSVLFEILHGQSMYERDSSMQAAGSQARMGSILESSVELTSNPVHGTPSSDDQSMDGQ